METRTVQVPGISCGHCTRTIQNEVGELDGVASVEASVETKEVTIAYGPPTSWEQIRALLEEIGFPPAA